MQEPSALSRLRASAPPNLFDVLPPLSSVVFEPHDWPGFIPYRFQIGTFTDPSDPDTVPRLPVWAYLSLRASRIPHYPTRVVLELGAHKDDPTDPTGDREITWELFYENIRHGDVSDVGDDMVVLEGMFAEEKSRGDLFALVKYYFLLVKEDGKFAKWDGHGVSWCESWGQSMRAICRRTKRHEERKKRGGSVEEKSAMSILRPTSLNESSESPSGDEADGEEDDRGSDTGNEEISTAARTPHSRLKAQKNKEPKQAHPPRPKCKTITLSEYLAQRQRYEERRAVRQVPKPLTSSLPKSKYLLQEDSYESDDEPKPRPIAPKPNRKRHFQAIDTSSSDTDEEPSADSGWRSRSIVRNAKRLATSRIRAVVPSKNTTDSDISSPSSDENADMGSDSSSHTAEDEVAPPRMPGGSEHKWPICPYRCLPTSALKHFPQSTLALGASRLTPPRPSSSIPPPESAPLARSSGFALGVGSADPEALGSGRSLDGLRSRKMALMEELRYLDGMLNQYGQSTRSESENERLLGRTSVTVCHDILGKPRGSS